MSRRQWNIKRESREKRRGNETVVAHRHWNIQLKNATKTRGMNLHWHRAIPPRHDQPATPLIAVRRARSQVKIQRSLFLLFSRLPHGGVRVLEHRLFSERGVQSRSQRFNHGNTMWVYRREKRGHRRGGGEDTEIEYGGRVPLKGVD